MRVVLADNFADRPGRLLVRAVGVDAALVHRVEDAAVDRLEAVAHVRQSARGDDRHGVLDEGLLHLATELADLQRAAVHIRAGVLAAVVGAEALLELTVVVLFLVIIGIGVIGVRIAVLALLSTGKQALQIVGHTGVAGLAHTLVIVDIVCHVTSSWFAWSISSLPRRRLSQVPQIRSKEEGSVLGYATDD